MAHASFSNWDPYRRYVASGGEGPGMDDQRHISGAFMGLFAGPPRLAHMGVGGASALVAGIESGAANQLVYPIGVVQNFGLSSNRQMARIYELGSERSYWIPGRTFGQVNLGRVMYHGPNLLRTLYAYYEDLLPPTLVPSVFPNGANALIPNQHNVINPPGFENFYANLASDLFNQPVGLLAMLRDSNMGTYGAFYLESVVVPQHMFSTDAQGVIVQEQCGLQYERMVPIEVQDILLEEVA